MGLSISSGRIQAPIKGLVYGPEGIGKTTFASKWPKPLFIDVEGGTANYEVDRIDRPSSWAALRATVDELGKGGHGYQTIVIDTADWATQLCAAAVCAKAGKSGIEDFGYGKGWVMMAEEFGRFLDSLDRLRDGGCNILFLAHAWTRKFDAPEQTDSYDRWEMKMEKKTASLLKEWADLMIFANYEIIVEETEGGKAKARGGKRVMFTNHHPCWDAKNRYDLPEKMPFEFAGIAGIFGGDTAPKAAPVAAPPARAATPPPRKATPPAPPAKPAEAPPADDVPADLKPATPPPRPAAPAATAAPAAQLPPKLVELMTGAGISEEEVRKAVAKRGYYPEDTPIHKYPQSFIDGVLVAAWEKVRMVVETQVRAA